MNRTELTPYQYIVAKIAQLDKTVERLQASEDQTVRFSGYYLETKLSEISLGVNDLVLSNTKRDYFTYDAWHFTSDAIHRIEFDDDTQLLLNLLSLIYNVVLRIQADVE